MQAFRNPLEKAQKLSEKGDHDAARTILKTLATGRTSPFLWNALAVESMKSGRQIEAEEAFLEAALWSGPDDAVADLRMILPAHLQPKAHWKPVDYWFVRGADSARSGAIESALRDLKTVIRLEPTRIRKVAELCQALKKEGIKVSAGSVCLFAFETLNDRRHDDVQLKNLRKDMFTSTMVLAQDTNDQRLAAFAMFNLVKRWPVDAAIRFVRKALRETHSEALPIVLELLAAKHPQSSELNLARARLLKTHGRMSELLELAEKLDPKLRGAVSIYSLAIDAAFQLNQPKRAISLAGRLRGAQPYLRENSRGLIRILLRAELPARARSEAMLSLLQFPRDRDITRLLALAQAQTGDFKQAMSLMEDALRVQPKDPFAANFVAYGLAEENRTLERALRLIEIALTVHPESTSYLDTKAWILYRKGQFKRAHDILAPIVERNEMRSELLFHLACIEYRLTGDGLERYKRAMALEKSPVQRGRYEREWKSIHKD